MTYSTKQFKTNGLQKTKFNEDFWDQRGQAVTLELSKYVYKLKKLESRRC